MSLHDSTMTLQLGRVVDFREELLAEFQHRLESLNYSPHTRRAYLRVARGFLRAYPDVRIEAVTPEHIERYFYGRRLSPRSMAGDIENLRPFFKWLHRHKRLLRANPCEGVERPRWKPRLRSAPTWDEFCAMRAKCQTVEEAALLEVLYFTGVRLGELRRIRISDVDLARRRILVHGKGDKDRIVVFPSRVGVLLKLHAWRQGLVHADAYLFRPGGRGDAPQRSERVIRRILRRLGEDAGLSYRLIPHILRHGWFRFMKTRGVPLEVAMKLGGHSDIRVTAHIYGRLDIDDLQAAYDRVLDASPTPAPVEQVPVAAAPRDLPRFTRTHAVPIRAIQTAVAEFFGIAPEEITAPRRTKGVVFPRQLAMFLARELTAASYPYIGERFGGRDHTTVIGACRRVRETLQRDPRLAASLKKLADDLQAARDEQS